MDRPRVVDENDRLDPRYAPEPPTFPDPQPTEHGERGYKPIHPRWGIGELVRKLFAPLIALGFLILKFGGFLLKFKVVTTGASMLVSIAAYAWLWGLPFAIGFVVLIFVHELGHVIELRRQGVPASAPLFIPFLGAVIGMKELPDDAWKEARVALAGPILGSVGAAVCWVAGEAADSDLLIALAFVGFFLNLLNLLPVLPLDGGRAMAALSPWVWVVGYAGLVALTIVFPNPILLLVLLLGGLETWRRWKLRHTPEARAYNDIPGRTRALVALTYLGLAALLAVGVSETFLERDFGDA
jgi:Zn-dependent protease